MQVTNKSIRNVLSRVQSSEIILPALQREYVWKRRDIEGLFDSLLQGYPINTFMSWEVSDILQQSMEFYLFLNPKYKEGNVNSDYINNTHARKSVIIDGQQRLTSLYIALYGSYTTAKRNKEMFLYLNMDSALVNACTVSNEEDDEDLGNQMQSDENMIYNFHFMLEGEASSRKAKGEHWLKLSDAFISTFNPYLWLSNNGLIGNEFACKTMEDLMQMFKDEALLNFYEINRNSMQDALDIFIRTNNGGKRLTKGDLLLSMITVFWANGSTKENARRYVENIVQAVADEGYKVDKDWVLKCTLFLLAPDVKMDVKNFGKDVSTNIFNNKDRIQESISAAFSLVKSFGIQEKGLTSKLAILPIVYFIYHHNLYKEVRKNYSKGVAKSVSNGYIGNMRTWLYRALVREFFTNGSDNKLKEVRTIMHDHMKKDYYPLHKIVDHFKNNNANLNVDDKTIEILLKTPKKESYTLLNIIYADKIDDVKKMYDVDHMHPQKDSSKCPGYDTLPNLQLLDYEQNRSKNARSLNDWYNSLSDVEKQRLVIPNDGVSLDLKNFEQFFYSRKMMLGGILAKYLDVPNSSYLTE